MTKSKMTPIAMMMAQACAAHGLDLENGVRRRIEAFAAEEVRRAIIGQPSQAEQRTIEAAERCERESQERESLRDQHAKALVNAEARGVDQARGEFARLRVLDRVFYRQPESRTKLVIETLALARY